MSAWSTEEKLIVHYDDRALNSDIVDLRYLLQNQRKPVLNGNDISSYDYDINLHCMDFSKLNFLGSAYDDVFGEIKRSGILSIRKLYDLKMEEMIRLGFFNHPDASGTPEYYCDLKTFIEQVNETIEAERKKDRNAAIQHKSYYDDLLGRFEKVKCVNKIKFNKFLPYLKELFEKKIYVDKKSKIGKVGVVGIRNYVSKVFKIENVNTADYAQYVILTLYRFYEMVIQIAKEEKIKRLTDFFEIDYGRLKKRFMDDICADEKNYAFYYRYHIGNIFQKAMEHFYALCEWIVKEEVKKRVAADAIVQYVPVAIGIVLTVVMFLLYAAYQFTLLKEIKARTIIIVLGVLVGVSLGFSIVNLCRNKKLRRPVRKRFQIVWTAAFAFIAAAFVFHMVYFVERYDGYNDRYYYVSMEEGIKIDGLFDKEQIRCDIPEEIDGKKVLEVSKNTFKGNKNVREIYFNDDVVLKDDGMFRGCGNVVSVHLPLGYETIPKKTFDGCGNLMSIDGFEKITTIKEYAFRDCVLFNSDTILENLSYLGKNAFENCYEFVDLYIPSLADYVGKDAFKNVNPKAVSLPYGAGDRGLNYYFGKNGLTNLRTLYVYRCEKLPAGFAEGCLALEDVFFMESLTEIGERAFANCSSLSRIILPDDTTTIGDKAFMGCSSLQKVTLSQQTTAIGASCFAGCISLSEVLLPSSVTNVGEGAFASCSALQKVTLEGNGVSVAASAFRDCSSLQEIDCVKMRTIGESAFAGCADLTTIDLSTVAEVGKSAFAGCSGIKEIKVSASLKRKGSVFVGGGRSIDLTILDADQSAVETYFDSAARSRILTVRYYANSIPKRMFYGCDSLRDVVIDGEITAIDENAFANCSSLKRIEFGNSVTAIGSKAFMGCSSLTEIILSEQTETIGDSAFENCVSLKTITIPASVTEIRKSAFASCVSLETVLLEGTNIVAMENAFRSCSSLSEIDLARVKRIGASAFAGCASLLNVDLRMTEKVGKNAFANCSGIRYVVVSLMTERAKKVFTGSGEAINLYVFNGDAKPVETYFDESAQGRIIFAQYESEDVIPKRMFYGCNSLRRIQIKGTITTIGKSAFEDCGALYELDMSFSECGIGDYAFKNCTALEEFSFDDVSTIGKYAFQNTGLESINVRDVKEIGRRAFRGCDEVQEIVLPKTEKIGRKIFDSKNASGVKLTIPDRKEKKALSAYFGNSLKAAITSIVVEETDGKVSNSMFYGCENLKSIQFTSPIYTIGRNAFRNCYNLRSTEFLANTEEIGRNAFRNCSSIFSLALSENLIEMGKNAFKGTSVRLLTMGYTGNVAKKHLSYYFGKSVVGECLEEVTVTKAESIGNGFLNSANELTTVRLPETVKKIGKDAFKDCFELQEINLPLGLREIGARAFASCYSWQVGTLDLTDVDTIGKSAFYQCNGIKKIEISGVNVKIEAEAFNNCAGLTEVDAEDIGILGEYAFSYCNALKKVTVTGSYSEIGAGCFSHCTSLTEATFYGSPTKIGKSAFGYCSSLQTIRLPDSVQDIGAKAFENCTSLKSFSVPSKVTRIRAKAFSGVGAIQMTLNGSIRKIDGYAFDTDKNLTYEQENAKKWAQWPRKWCREITRDKEYA